jgi:hypothetical protein
MLYLIRKQNQKSLAFDVLCGIVTSYSKEAHMSDTAQIDVLATVYKTLPVNDHDFAQSLISQGRRRPLSEKQSAWVLRLIAKAKGDDPVKAVVETKIDMSGIVSLFDTASKHLKRPSIVLATEAQHLRLNRAGETARFPDTINVIRESDREWLGRVHLDGRFEVSKRSGVDPQTLIPHLQHFAADPVTGAKESARLTGKCCFCNTRITDERSTNVGYGPICAKRFGLKY